MADVIERIVPRSPDQTADVSSAGEVVDVRARRPAASPRMQVRAADLEPYIGLKYLSRLFKLMAIVLILLLVSEVITGLVASGLEALPTLLGEVSRLVVFAGLLWGSGDLAILLIDMGHDLRATRILLGRQLAHSMDEQHHHVDPGMSQPGAEAKSTV
ncbi:MAG: hypothetical protein M3R65_03765 [Gemmatimonadota bacterium]|nr:hypothetical protein [Gemmatimonadota bacterium]